MKKLVVLFLCLFFGFYVHSQNRTVKVNPIKTVQKIERDKTLEQNAYTRMNKIRALLPLKTKERAAKIVNTLFYKMHSETNSIDYHSFVQKELQNNFKDVSEEQLNLLEFYVLSEVANKISIQKKMEQSRESVNEMSEMSSLRLQMTMDRRSKFISTLSQIMKKISTTQDTLIQNIK